MGKRIYRVTIGNSVIKLHKKGIGNAGHFLGLDSGGMNNCGGMISHITRPVRSMSSKGKATSKFDKQKWQKRVRGYLKSQTKILML